MPISALITLALVLVPAPVEINDSAIRERIAEAGDAKDYSGASTVVVWEDVAVDVDATGLATTEQLRLVKLLKPDAIRSHAVATFDFDPQTNRFQIQRIRIHRAAGGVDDVDLSAVRTSPAPAGTIFWGGMLQSISLPRPVVGDVIETHTVRTGFNLAYLTGGPGPEVGATGLQPPMPGHWHDTVYFQEDVPVIEKRYRVTAPTDKPIQYEICHGALDVDVRFKGEVTEYTFSGEDLTPVKREPRREAYSDVATKVVLTSVHDWVAKSKWFHDANVDQFESTPEMEAKVAEIITGIREPREQMRAINCWVADHVRYIGTTRGPCEGYTMHEAAETFKDRGGVCKDKAGLAVAMLRIAGFDAFPVMTQAGSQVEYTPADQFNHAVAMVREKDGTLTLLDPTWSPKSRELWSSRECLQYVVYGLPEGRDLGQSPYFPPAHNSVELVSTATLTAGGALSDHLVFNLKNYPCTSFRRAMARHRVDERRDAIEGGLGFGPRAMVKAVSHTDPYDYRRDTDIDLTVEVPGWAMVGPERMSFTLPALQHPFESIWASDILERVKKDDDRAHGMRLRTTRRLHYEETLTLPAHWRVEQLPESVDVENGAGLVKFDIKQEGNRLAYSLTVEARRHIVPAEEYDLFRAVNEELLDLRDARVWCTSDSGGMPSPAATEGATR